MGVCVGVWLWNSMEFTIFACARAFNIHLFGVESSIAEAPYLVSELGKPKRQRQPAPKHSSQLPGLSHFFSHRLPNQLFLFRSYLTCVGRACTLTHSILPHIVPNVSIKLEACDSWPICGMLARLWSKNSKLVGWRPGKWKMITRFLNIRTLILIERFHK